MRTQWDIKANIFFLSDCYYLSFSLVDAEVMYTENLRIGEFLGALAVGIAGHH